MIVVVLNWRLETKLYSNLAQRTLNEPRPVVNFKSRKFTTDHVCVKFETKFCSNLAQRTTTNGKLSSIVFKFSTDTTNSKL